MNNYERKENNIMTKNYGINITRDNLFELLYERIIAKEMNTYHLLNIALNHIADYELDNFINAIVLYDMDVK